MFIHFLFFSLPFIISTLNYTSTVVIPRLIGAPSAPPPLPRGDPGAARAHLRIITVFTTIILYYVIYFVITIIMIMIIIIVIICYMLCISQVRLVLPDGEGRRGQLLRQGGLSLSLCIYTYLCTYIYT